MIFKIVYRRGGTEMEEELVDCISEHGARAHAEMTLNGGGICPDIKSADGWKLEAIVEGSKAELRRHRRRMKEDRE